MATLRHELLATDIHLPSFETTETPVSLAAWALETPLQAILDEVSKIEQLRQQLEQQLHVSQAAA